MTLAFSSLPSPTGQSPRGVRSVGRVAAVFCPHAEPILVCKYLLMCLLPRDHPVTSAEHAPSRAERAFCGLRTRLTAHRAPGPGTP